MNVRGIIAVVVSGIYLLGASTALHAAEEEQGARKPQLDALLKELKAHARKWVKSELTEKESAAMGKKLDAVTYDLTSVRALTVHLRRNGTAGKLYVINGLLKPLVRADSHVIKKALPAVHKIYKRTARYYNPNKSGIKDGNIGVPRREVSPDAILAGIARQQKKGERKLVVETRLAKMNRQVHVFTNLVFELMLLSNSPREHNELIREFQKQEQATRWTYADIVDIVCRNVKKLEAQQAAAFHAAFVEYGEKVRMKRAIYTCPSELIIVISGRSGLGKKHDYPGIRILDAANKLAKAAGVERFIFSSSCSNYGAGAEGGQLTEESAFNPVTPYGQSKVNTELDVAPMADDNFSPTFMRSATAFGLSPRLRFDLVLNNLVAWAYTTGKVFLKSDGSAWRPMAALLVIACLSDRGTNATRAKLRL